MAIPRVRFTTQTLVIGTAVTAVLLGGARIYNLRRQADHYAASARYWTWQAENASTFAHSMRDMTEAEYRDGCLRLVHWDLQMRKKYLRAASHPWQTVPPDPPRPK